MRTPKYGEKGKTKKGENKKKRKAEKEENEKKGKTKRKGKMKKSRACLHHEEAQRPIRTPPDMCISVFFSIWNVVMAVIVCICYTYATQLRSYSTVVLGRQHQQQQEQQLSKKVEQHLNTNTIVQAK